MIKTLIVLLVICIIVTKFNSYYRDYYDGVFEMSKTYIKTYIEKNPYFLYLYVTILFFIASKSSLFKFTNGYYGSYIKSMLHSVTTTKNEYNEPTPFVIFTTIFATIIFSLLTTISGSGLGSEGIMIYISICLMLYLYFKFKKILNLNNINTELLIYLGYTIGFDATFTSILSTIVFIFEKMIIYHSSLLYTYNYNIIILLLFITFIHYSIKNRNPILDIKKIHFDYYNTSNVIFIIILSIIIGLLCHLFFTSFISLYNILNNSKYKDIFVILFGFILAFMIQYCGLFISGTSEYVINEGFKNASIIDNSNNSESFNYKNVVGKIINCIISLGSGLSGGIIIPSMTIGSGLGNVFYKMLMSIYSDNSITIPIENFMYIGMIAFLSPMLDAPTTSAIVVNRISNQSFNTIPISLISSFTSYYIYKKLHK